MRTPLVLAPLAVAAVLLPAACSSSEPDADGTPRPPATPATSPSPSSSQGGTGAPRVLVTGLKAPWGVAFLPGGDALVTERDTARLLRVTPSGRTTVAGTVPGVRPEGEGGLLGVAVSPSYDRDHLIYLYFSADDGNRVARASYDGRLGALTPIVTGIPKGGIHNGGRLAFGPDRMLYISTGETGRRGLAQDRNSLAGKILRVTPGGAPAPGNPFGTRVWSYGHRNVQGLAWDDTGQLFATEFGQDRYDEINRIAKGGNYGWPLVEGRGHRPGLIDPLVTWPTSEASPSGLAYAGDALWAAALGGRRLWRVPLNGGATGRPSALYTGTYGRLRTAARAPDGSLWLTTSNRDGRGAPTKDDDRILTLQPR